MSDVTGAQRAFIKFDRRVFGLNLNIQTLTGHDHFLWARRVWIICSKAVSLNTGVRKQPINATKYF